MASVAQRLPEPAAQTRKFPWGPTACFAVLIIAVVPAFRIGVAGYFLRQITDSQANGRAVAGSREQVAEHGFT